MRNVVKELRIALTTTLALATIVCAAYPVAIFALGQGLFPRQANGSLVAVDGFAVGSTLLGQQFEAARYFHPRPSAAGKGYDPMASGGTNLGPISKTLAETVKQRVESYRRENGLPADTPVPADAVTASASGLDPHISVENATLQASRVASARGLPLDAVTQAIQQFTEGRTLWILGQPRVNVLELNMALDAAERNRTTALSGRPAASTPALSGRELLLSRMSSRNRSATEPRYIPPLGGRLSPAAGFPRLWCPLFGPRPSAPPSAVRQLLCNRRPSDHPRHPERSEGSQPPRATTPARYSPHPNTERQGSAGPAAGDSRPPTFGGPSSSPLSCPPETGLPIFTMENRADDQPA